LPPLFARGQDDRPPRRRWTDRLIGIAVGVVLGLGVLVYFVFVHSEGTIDAPQVNGSQTTTTGQTPNLPAHPGSPKEPAETPAGGATGKAGTDESTGKAGGEATGPTPTKPEERPVPIVKVIGGAPPTGTGPKDLHFRKGEKVRFEIETDEPFSFEIKGLGITESIEQSSIISFKATKSGQFPVIATATLIGVADLLIKK
jgi:hypothetical protein